MTAHEEVEALVRAIERRPDSILSKVEEAHDLLKDMIRDCEAHAAHRRKTV